MKKGMILSSIATLLITSMVMTGTSKNVYALTDFQENFIDSIKHKVTKILLKEKLYSTVKNFYDKMLNELYTNLQLF